jgi:hypothetical protein
MPVPACGSGCAREGASSEAEPARGRREPSIEAEPARGRREPFERGGARSREPLTGPLWWAVGATAVWVVPCVCA